MLTTITVSELMTKENPIIIDVRDEQEYAFGHIANTIHLPLQYFETRLNALNKDKTYYIICHSGARSHYACMIAKEKGYNVVNVIGGMSAYKGELSYEV